MARRWLAAAAQDEVSVAIASLFGNFGEQFQAVSAQAQAFHAQFVSVMNGSAAAYISTEAANAGEGLLGGAVTAPAQAVAQALGAPGLIQGVSSFGAAVAAPYQALVSNTVTNLQAINSTFAADPFPFLNQVAANQTGFANTFGSGLLTDLQGFPANVPANVQLAIQGAPTLNPGALAQGFINGQIGTGQTIQAGVQGAFQNLLAGNPIGAYSGINQTLQNLLLPGFNTSEGGLNDLVFTFTPSGFLADLAPILALPGSMAQNFTNLLPPGSILTQMAQNSTNLVNAFTNFNTSLDLNVAPNPNLTFGVPLQLAFDAIGGPANALSSLNSTVVALAGALQTGNMSAAAAAILDAPAVVTNGFLNGSTLLTLPTAYIFDGFEEAVVQIPLGGILTPLSVPPVFAAFTGLSSPGPFPLGPGSTEIGGLIPGLLGLGPELAQAITPLG